MRNVIKFGGSSLCDGASMSKAAAQTRADGDNAAVVVSAPGKRRRGDEKMTDLLYKYAGGDRSAFDIFKNRLADAVAALNVPLDFSAELRETEIAAARGDVPFVASRGEYFCAKIMARLLDAKFVDAADVISFSGGTLDENATFSEISRAAQSGERIIIPGFYGADERGAIKTFPRGGSDITGSIVAAAIGADVYKNCTDVEGFMFCPPQYTDRPRVIGEMTYEEALFLSRGGAGVIHADAVGISRAHGTVINLRKSFDLSSPGTMIGDFEKSRGVYGISGRLVSKADAEVCVGIHQSGRVEAKASASAITGCPPVYENGDGLIFSLPASELDKTMSALAAAL